MSEQRLWRLRKLHQSVDAELRQADDADDAGSEAGAEVRFLYNGELSYARACPTRSSALAEAAAKRAELERDGWTFHW